MRLPWISRRPSQRAATRRKQAAPLRVRRLERRRVLDAAVADLVFAPADLDGSTAIHDTNEGSAVTVTADASGTAPLLFEWKVTKDAAVVAQTFSQELIFTPTDNGIYSVTLTVHDGIQSSASRTEDILVHNVRPVLVVAADQVTTEGTLLDLSAIGAPPLGLFIDPGSLDTHTATVDWGDGSAVATPTIFAGSGSGALSGTHTYTDNGIYTVTVTVTDDDGGSATQTFQVTVGNIAPTATLSNNGPVDEGSAATVTFSNQFDPSAADTAAGFRYAYDLDNDGAFDIGDGTYAGSTTAHTQVVSAALLADGPGTRTVRAWVIDKDGAHTEYTTDVTINNVAPQLINIAVTDATINEGQTATIKMTIEDPGALDVFAVEVNWQDGAPADTISGLGMVNASGTVGGTTYQWNAQARELTVSHLYPDDNPTVTSSDVYAVALTVRDDDLGMSGTYQTNITVSNVRPVLVVAADQSIDEGGLLALTGLGSPVLGVFIDDGKQDTHAATIDWGDGSAIELPTVNEVNGSGALGASHTYTDNGVYTVTVTVTDDDGGTATQTFQVTVGNVAPTATLGNNGPVNEGSTAMVTFSNQFDPGTADTLAGFRYAYDLDNDGTFDVGDGTYAGSVGTSSQLVSAALLAEGPGTHVVKGRIIDKDGGFNDYTTTIIINNVEPKLVNIVVADASIDEGDTAQITMKIDDPGVFDTFEVDVNWQDGGGTDTIVGLGAANSSGTVGDTAYQWNAATRELTVRHLYQDDNPTATASDLYQVQLAVRDDDGGSGGPYQADITVNNVRPVLVVAANQNVNEGQLLDLSGSGAPVLGVFIDEGKQDTHTATVDWGDGSPIQVPTIIAVDGSGAITATHTYADDGVYTVTVTITDDDGGVDVQQFQVTVLNVNPTLTVTPSPTAINEGGIVSFNASFSDPGFDNPLNPGAEKAETFTYDVDWGDGRDAVSGQAVADTNGSPGTPSTGVFTGSHTYADDGVYTVTVTIHDDDGGVHVQTFQVTVSNVNPTLVVTPSPTAINEGGIVSFNASFSDPGFDNPLNPGAEKAETFTYDVDWGDGRDAVSGQAVADTNGSPGTPSTGMFTGSHTYADDGVYTVTVTIHDDDGGVHVQTFQVTVSNVNPTLVVTPSPTAINEGGTVSFNASFSDPGFDNPLNPGAEKAETFTYDIDWGDGRDAVSGQAVADTNGSPGTPSTGMFTGSHTYADDGVYTVTVTIHDDDGGVHVQTFQVTVMNVAPTLVLPNGDQVVNEGQLLSLVNLGTFSDPGFDNPLNPGAEKAETFTYDVDWGDGRDAIVGASIADLNGGPGVSSTGTIAGAHTYADDGVYTVTVTIHDDDGGSHTQTFTVTVNNVAPTLAVTPSITTISEGQTINFSAIFSDPGFDNPLNPGAEKVESFTFDVDWGDGRNAVSGQVVADTNGGPGVNSTGNFSGSHTYADDGTYTVNVTIHDDDGGSHVQTFVVVVTNVAPSLTGTSNIVVNEGQVITLGGLGVGLTDPGFDNPLNPTTPPSGLQFTEEFAAYTINWGDGTTDVLNIANRASNQVAGPTTAALTNLNQLLNRMDHVYADNGAYTVTIRVADDNMGAFADAALFQSGTQGVDYVDLTFVIEVRNVVPTVTLPNGNLPAGGQVIFESQTISLTNLGVVTDPGFNNPLNPLSQPGGSTEQFKYWVDWDDDGTFDSASTGNVTIDDVGGVEDLTDGSFDQSHTYADNGVYTVRVRIADDDMGAFGNLALFKNGVAGTDFVEVTFTIVVTNAGPAFTPQPNGSSFQGDDINTDGITTIRVAYNDPGYDNPLNTQAANGGERVETFNHVIQWGDGTVDAIHQYTTAGSFTVTVTMTPSGGTPQQFTFSNFNSSNPVLTLVSSQQLNDPSVVAQVVTYTVNWGDGHTETFQLSLLNPGVPVASNGLTTLVTSTRNSGNALTNTTGTAEVQHRYLGPPNPLNPTADIVITLSVYDDDGASVTDFIAVSNPGIQTINVAIDTTPDVARLDLTIQPMTVVYVADQKGGGQSLQIPDLRSGGGEVAATAERYLELRVVYPDGTESEGYRIKDEALVDLRAFFKTLPDGKYRIYLMRTENNSSRLVIEVDVRGGRVIDVSDDSEGTRDRPPTGNDETGEEASDAVPLEQNPHLEQVPAVDSRQGDKGTSRQEAGEIGEFAGNEDERISLSPPLLVSLSAAASVVQPWSRRVDDALANADHTVWQRLRRAGRSGRNGHRNHRAPARQQRNAATLDYNRN